ncbi:MAG: rod shape-determining protein MreC [Gammaproteobacteria bacterium]|nr:MAG: rod shape-determining protein MreC [Gammaproteobacteria bacterium]
MNKPVSTITSGKIGLVILAIVLSVVIMVFDYQGKMPWMRSAILTYISVPVKTAAAWPGSMQRYFTELFVSQSQLQEENEKLKKEVSWLKATLANQTVLEAEHRRLKRLFDSAATRTRPVMIAEVLDSFIDANKHQIEINKGTNDGAFEGQIAIDEYGVVGQITQLTDKMAIIGLITDIRQRVPVFVERNRLRMIARGTGILDELEMEFVAKTADIRVGDKLVTSGLGERFPRGYGIAIVTEVENSPVSEFLQIKAKPLAALDKVLEVLLISPRQTIESVSYVNDK